MSLNTTSNEQALTRNEDNLNEKIACLSNLFAL